MRRRRPAIAVPACALIALALASPPATAKVRITGQLKGSTSGMAVLALAPDGTATTASLRRGGRFALSLDRTAARGATLQLIRASGAYLGPVVLRSKGRRAYSVLRGRPARLGAIRLRQGYATPVHSVPTSLVDRSRWAGTDARGRPVGAGRLGLTRTTSSTRPRSILAREQGGGGEGVLGVDEDRDGIPNLADVDDNGNGTLDGVDPVSAARNAGLFTTLFLRLDRTLNVNSGGVSTAQIDAQIADDAFNLIFFFDTGRFAGRRLTGAHVDCFELSYCRRGAGTATVDGVSESGADLPRGSRWTSYDPDGSGFPNLERIVSHDGHDVFAMAVHPRAATSEIRPGDTYGVVFDTDAGPLSVPTVLSPYFVTVPALASYASGGGSPTAVSYPVPDGSAGTDRNPVQLSSDQLSLTFWRPQRAGIAGADPGPFMDMGHLFYGVIPAVQGTSGGGEFGCDGFYSGLSPTLGPKPPSGDSFADALWPLVDGADDAAPDAANTLGFTIDLGGCLRAHGLDPAGKAVNLSLTAAGASRPGGADRAVQTFSVRLPG